MQIGTKWVSIAALLIIICPSIVVATGSANTGAAEPVGLDGAALPKELIPAYNQFKTHCTVCHSQERVFSRLNELSHLDPAEYDSYLRNMMAKKIRLRDAAMSRQAGQQIYNFLSSLYKKS